MTGGELSAEERAEWRADAERRRDGRGNTPQNQRILALLDALDAAEARVVAVEAERDEGALATERENGNLRAENRRLAALVEAGLALADEWDDFEHDMIACQKYDCGDCMMKNAVHDLRAALGGTA
jgi:hypothetical protein